MAFVKFSRKWKKTNKSIDTDKLRRVLASIIIEQSSCERSGEQWGQDTLVELYKAIPERANNEL